MLHETFGDGEAMVLGASIRGPFLGCVGAYGFGIHGLTYRFEVELVYIVASSKMLYFKDALEAG